MVTKKKAKMARGGTSGSKMADEQAQVESGTIHIKPAVNPGPDEEGMDDESYKGGKEEAEGWQRNGLLLRPRTAQQVQRQWYNQI